MTKYLTLIITFAIVMPAAAQTTTAAPTPTVIEQAQQLIEKAGPATPTVTQSPSDITKLLDGVIERGNRARTSPDVVTPAEGDKSEPVRAAASPAAGIPHEKEEVDIVEFRLLVQEMRDLVKELTTAVAKEKDGR